MSLKAQIVDGRGSGRRAEVDARNRLQVGVQVGVIPEEGISSVLRYFNVLLGSQGAGAGITSAVATISDSATDGACADHTSPTFTFTSATGGLTGATRVNITDTGAGGNGLIAQYEVSAVTDDNTVSLTADPTNGTDETGLDWNLPATAIFFVDANKDYDTHITQLIVFIGDASMTHDTFGAIDLSGGIGIDLHIEEVGINTNILTKAKSNADILIQASSTIAWGDAATSFELTNYSGTKDAFVSSIPLGFDVPGGVRIGRGTADRIVLTVNDDLTGLDDFTIRAVGYRHYP